jgi:hypothetical protein
LLPIDFRLADAIRETEWLDAVEICGPQPTKLLESFIPPGAREASHEWLEPARFGEKHYHEVRNAPCISPGPLRRGIRSDIAQSA